VDRPWFAMTVCPIDCSMPSISKTIWFSRPSR
jgi:hypothetical protein